MANVAKSLERIKSAVESGAYYEAQQQYKSTFHRHKARRQLAESLHVLQDGAVTQLRHGQVTCGVELGQLLVEVYNSEGIGADDVSVARLTSILEAFPGPASTSGGTDPEAAATASIDELSRLVSAAVKWAQKCSAPEVARQLNSQYAKYLWATYGATRVGRALLHFIRGADASTFADALYTCAAKGPGSEQDLWLLRAVLQVLAAASRKSSEQQLKYARELFSAYVRRAPKVLDTPTGHCADLLLLAVEHDSLDMYEVACDKYDAVLRRDSSLSSLASRTKELYFPESLPQGGGLGGLLGGLLKSLGEMPDE